MSAAGDRHLPHLRDLNDAQHAAATTLEGPVLVLAGAGSGKTRTLVHRIVHLLETGVEPRRILAVTFTNRAAEEMRARVVAVVGRRARPVTLSTFHALGARILREHSDLAGLPERYAIYSAGEQVALLRHILAEEVHVTATAGEETYDVRRVLAQISAWKNRSVGPGEARLEVAAGRVRGNRTDDYAVLAADAFRPYEESLRAAGACDFDDLLLLPVALLRQHLEVREAAWRRWHYVMVDEYQDTNGVQLELARQIAGPRKNLCVVGDDDQSIYAWRGADLRNILDFESHFPGARVVVLDENYRSTQRILEAANAVIAHNPGRKPKWMRTANGLGPKIDYWEFGAADGMSAEAAEAAMVAREVGIRRYHEGLGWRDFAVLYRANHQSRQLEEALRESNIPYRLIGGTSFFERKEVADAAAYLRAILNPRDDLSLRRIINYPTRGIGRTTLLRLLETARARCQPLSEALRRVEAVEGISPAQAAAVRAFVELLDEARAGLPGGGSPPWEDGTDTCPLARWAEALFRQLRLEETIRHEAKGSRAGEIRVQNLKELVWSLEGYERSARAAAPPPDEEAEWEPPTLAAFLQRVALYSDDATEREEEDGTDRVTLLTLHSAKGLEFPHVFLVGLEEELLPHARSVHEAGDDGATAPIAEERRLLYVGMTRARHRLTLSGCRSRRRGTESLPRFPSRFLKEIPPEFLDIRTPGVESSLSEGDRQELKQNFFAQMREMLGER